MPPNEPSNELETSYSPRRRRLFVALSTLSALFAVAGLISLAATLPARDTGAETPPAQSPHDLVTDGLGDAIAIETQPPTLTDPSDRSTAVVHATTRGITFACGGPPITQQLAVAVPYDVSCTATSAGGFAGEVTFSCDAPAWVVCDATRTAGTVRPEHPLETLWTFALRPDAPSGQQSLRMLARANALTYEDSVPFVVPGPDGLVEALACTVSSSGVLAGATKQVQCTYVPGAFRGTLHPVCQNVAPLTRCDVPPSVSVPSGDAVGFNATWSFDVMAPAGDYGPLEIALPARDRSSAVAATIAPTAGTFTIDCPSVVTALLFDLHVDCTATSVDGFDAYVRFTPVLGAELDALDADPVVVRVGPGDPAEVPIDLASSSELPIGNFVDGLLVRGQTSTLTVDGDGILVQIH